MSGFTHTVELLSVTFIALIVKDMVWPCLQLIALRLWPTLCLCKFLSLYCCLNNFTTWHFFIVIVYANHRKYTMLVWFTFIVCQKLPFPFHCHYFNENARICQRITFEIDERKKSKISSLTPHLFLKMEDDDIFSFRNTPNTSHNHPGIFLSLYE